MTRGRALALALVAIALGSTLLWRHERAERESEDFPEGTFWLCLSCGRGFNKSIHELGVWYARNPGPPPCPACGQARTVRAYRCPRPECHSYFTNAVTVLGRPACPICRRPL